MRFCTNKKGLTTVGILLAVVLAIAGVLSLSMVGQASTELGSRYKETVGSTSLTSYVHCAQWSDAPEKFQEDIEKAAAKAGVHPALIGAIFLSEHGDAWATPGSDGVWAQGGAGKGPFQIENWSGYWSNVTSFGYGSGDGNVENMYDSALATAISLKIGFEKAGIISKVNDDASNIADQKYIIFAGMYHNRGEDNALTWAKTNYNMDTPPVNNKNPGWVWGAPYPNPGGLGYALRTWKNFQGLNNGCASAAFACSGGVNGSSPNCSIANTAIQIALQVKNENPSSSSMAKKTSDYAQSSKNWSNYSACSNFVAYVMKKSGVDASFANGSVVGTEFPYIKSSGKYTILPISSGLQPGDILIRGYCNGGKCVANTTKGYGHIEIYVGQNSVFPNQKFVGASMNHHGPTAQAGVDMDDMGIIARFTGVSS